MNEKEIYEKLKYCLENNIKISKSLLIDYINLLIDKYKLKDEVSNLYFDCNNDDANGLYNDTNKQLFINYNRISKDYNDELFNMKILSTIFHELTHVCQFNIYKNPETLDEVFKDFYLNLQLTFNIPDTDEDYYLENYDDFIFENQARINSIFKLMFLMEKLNIDDKLEYVNRILAKIILNIYKDNSPLDKSINLLQEQNINFNINNINIDNYHKIIFGYPIDNETIETIRNISKNKIKTKNILNNI